jgi:hypothetical protein
MKYLLIGLLMLVSSLVFAEQRFTDKERAEFIKETKIDAQEFKAQNQGKFDLQILKPFILQGLEEHNLNKKFTKAEMIQIKAALEKYMQDPKNNYDEERFFKNLDASLAEISKQGLEKVKAGGICNELSCDKNLTCVSDPKQNTDGRKCSIGSKECKIDSDCCSDYCVESKTKGKKLCAPIKRCYVPVKLGSSCLDVPACEAGTCLPYNAETIGIGECVSNKNKCSNDSECCSNLCSGGTCKENLVCKSCSANGEKAESGKKCCEGLYKGTNDVCIPDVPPIVPPQVNINNKSFLKVVLNFILPSANASEAYNEINGNRSKYENFQAKSADKDNVDFKGKTAGLGFSLKSNFESCDMHFREDFYAYLIKNKLFDQEVALLSFDYMMLGESNNDYWKTQKGNDESSVNGRLKKIAERHAETRTKTNEKIDEINRKLTCMCIDVIGVTKIKNDDKVAYFDKNCGDFKKSYAGDQNAASCNNLDGEKKSYNDSCGNGPVDGLTAADCTKLKTALDQKTATCAATPVEPKFIDDVKDGDASGVKSKRMLVYFTAQMSSFNQTLTVDNTKVYQGIASVRDWIQTEGAQRIMTTESRTYDLGDFTLNGFGNTAQAMGAAVVGAMLAAGVIAVLGGFATASMISTWAAVGIITASALASGGGVWMVASLKGAWIAKRPMVADQFLRTQSCGKKGKHTCTDWKRKLTQPYNPVCEVHTSANACVRNFLAYNTDDGFRYIVDPFIPVGVSKSGLLRSQPDHALNLEAGFQRALQGMQSKARHGTIGESYMWEEFIDDTMTGYYAPNLGPNPADTYLLNDKNIEEIKNKAKQYAIDQKFLVESDKENLNKFAEYAFEYHFKWPRTTLKDEISYPTVALDTYLDFMSYGVAAKLSAGGANAALTFGGLNAKYLQDYLSTLKMYETQANNLDDAQKAGLKNEILKTENALASNKALNALIATGNELPGLDNKEAFSKFANSNGASGVTLSGDQQDFAKAVGTLRKLRSAQLKKLDAFNKAVSRGDINKGRAGAVSKAFGSFNSKFNSPMTAAIGGKTFGGGSGSGTATDATTAVKEDAEAFKFTAPPAGFGTGTGTGSSIPSFGGFGKSGSTSKSSDSSGSGSGSGTGMSDDDSKKLNEAIQARDTNANKYQSSDENSLFEKITNAYIRNYDKVLTKKKQEKDLIDKKE